MQSRLVKLCSMYNCTCTPICSIMYDEQRPITILLSTPIYLLDDSWCADFIAVDTEAEVTALAIPSSMGHLEGTTRAF